MKNIAVACVLSALLSACLPSGENYYFFRPGQSFEGLRDDYIACRDEALEEVPLPADNSKKGGEQNTNAASCSAANKTTKQCRLNANNNQQSAEKTWDKNADYRNKRIIRCLKARCYKSMLLPECKTQQETDQALSAKKPTDVFCSPTRGFLID